MKPVVVRGDALQLPLPDASVDLIVTSPPYFALRSYTDGGVHYAGQIGSEPTPAEYIAALVECTREWVRVLKPSGSIFVNLGDKYASGDGSGNQNGLQGGEPATRRRGHARGASRFGVRPKSLMLLPERYRIACVNQLGLIARSVIIWDKPNGLPESVQDRVRRSHEDWVHLVKRPKYFAAVDEVREVHSSVSIARSSRNRFAEDRSQQGVGSPNTVRPEQACNPLGKLPGSVWSIEEDDDTVRGLLSAVASGSISVDEGERILSWRSASGSCPTCGLPKAAAGNGRVGGTSAATERPPQSEPEARTGLTESPTPFSSDPSPMGSPLTTSAATEDASTPSTSRSSPEPRTSAAPTPSRSGAHTTTPSLTPTSNGPEPAASTSVAARATSAVCVCAISDAPPSVWQIATEPLRVPEHLGVDHFAAFASEWPRRLILGWSPSGMCTACGEGRRSAAPQEKYASAIRTAREAAGLTRAELAERASCGTNNVWDYEVGGHLPRAEAWESLSAALDLKLSRDEFIAAAQYVTTGSQDTELRRSAVQHGAARPYTTRKLRLNEAHPEVCACAEPIAPTRPALVLDPFGGTGTTAHVAAALGRTGITVDLSADYCRLAAAPELYHQRRRKVLGLDKPVLEPIPEGQMSMFDEEAG